MNDSRLFVLLVVLWVLTAYCLGIITCMLFDTPDHWRSNFSSWVRGFGEGGVVSNVSVSGGEVEQGFV